MRVASDTAWDYNAINDITTQSHSKFPDPLVLKIFPPSSSGIDKRGKLCAGEVVFPRDEHN